LRITHLDNISSVFIKVPSFRGKRSNKRGLGAKKIWELFLK